MEDSEKILGLAKEKFMQAGFYRTSMDELARDLSMSKKTIYKYFESKEKLVEAIVTEIISGISQKMEQEILGEGNAVEKIIGMLLIIGTNVKQVGGERWLTDMKLHAPAVWKKVEEFRSKKLNANLKRIIKQGIEEGYFENLPIEIVLPVFISSVNGVVNPDFLIHNKFSFNQALEVTFSILINGILTDKGRKLLNKTKNRTDQ
ncbi:MAG: TetR/AcrR family transcriptional regulator [Ignavibacteria bacterium]